MTKKRKKTYKKIQNGQAIEETDTTEETSKQVYNIGSLKIRRDRYKTEYERLQAILDAVGEGE